jgi:hypothetical protein
LKKTDSRSSQHARAAAVTAVEQQTATPTLAAPSLSLDAATQLQLAQAQQPGCVLQTPAKAKETPAQQQPITFSALGQQPEPPDRVPIQSLPSALPSALKKPASALPPLMPASSDAERRRGMSAIGQFLAANPDQVDAVSEFVKAQQASRG